MTSRDSVDWLPGCYRNLAPHADESLGGFLLRLSEANGYDGIADLLCAAGVSHRATLMRNQLFTLRSDYDALRIIGRIAVGDPNALSGYLARPITESSMLFEHCLIERDAVLGVRAQICPQCLGEHGFVPLAWDYPAVTVCTKHACVLLDHCENCRTTIDWGRSSLLHCSECGWDYRRMRTVEASTNECHVADDFAALAPFRIQTYATDPTVARWDTMNRVFKSLVLPTHAWTEAVWPDSFLSETDISLRHRATRLLAETLSESCYDLRRVRKPAYDHLAALEVIPRSNVVEQQAMMLLHSEAGIQRDLAEPLCSKRPLPAPIRGAEIYAGRPPALRSHDELQAFLGASGETINGLFRKGLLVERQQDDIGFDIDMLLGAQNYLVTGLVSLSELAGLAGTPLDWEDIEHNRLVSAWNPLNPRDVRFDVSELLSIQLRLTAKQKPPDSIVEPVSLEDVAIETERPGMLVLHAVNMAQRGDLAFCWDEPYRWSSLQISDEDVEHLIHTIGPKTVR